MPFRAKVSRQALLAPSPSSRLLVRQEKEYTCGVACLQSVAGLLNLPVLKAGILEKELGTTSRIGTTPEAMTEWSATHLPLESVRQGAWEGQLAITLVGFHNTPQGEEDPHYEVLLGRVRKRIVAWCPYRARVRLLKDGDIRWRTTLDKRVHHRWTLNFKHGYSERVLAGFVRQHEGGRGDAR